MDRKRASPPCASAAAWASPCAWSTDLQQTGVALRGLQPGDLGWVISAHGRLYAQEYGFDASFERFVAGVAAMFDPGQDRSWIAERHGAVLGSVFLVRDGVDRAKLRLLIVEPAARGLGVGTLLVAACTEAARDWGVRRITLWTHAILLAARRIYAEAGYRLIKTEPIEEFGLALDSETWELELN